MDIEAKNVVNYNERVEKMSEDIGLDPTYEYDHESTKVSKLKESKPYRRFKTTVAKIEKWMKIARIAKLKASASIKINQISNANKNGATDEYVKEKIDALAEIATKLDFELRGNPYNAKTIEARAIRLQEGMLRETKRKIIKSIYKEELENPNVKPMTEESISRFEKAGEEREKEQQAKQTTIETPQIDPEKEAEDMVAAAMQGMADKNKTKKAIETPQIDPEEEAKDMVAAAMQGMADKNKNKQKKNNASKSLEIDVLAAFMAGLANRSKNKKIDGQDLAVQQLAKDGQNDLLKAIGINPDSLVIEDVNKFTNYLGNVFSAGVNSRTQGRENVYKKLATNEVNNEKFADYIAEQKEKPKKEYKVDYDNVCQNLINKTTRNIEEANKDLEEVNSILSDLKSKHQIEEEKEETKFDRFKEKAKDIASEKYKEARFAATDKFEEAKDYAEDKYKQAKEYVEKVEKIKETGKKALDKANNYLAQLRSGRSYPETKIEENYDKEDFDVGNESYVEVETRSAAVTGNYSEALKRMLEKEEENARLNEELRQREEELDRKIKKQEELRAKKEEKERELQQAIFERETKADKERARIQKREENQIKRSEILDRQSIESEESIDAIDNIIKEVRTGKRR